MTSNTWATYALVYKLTPLLCHRWKPESNDFGVIYGFLNVAEKLNDALIACYSFGQMLLLCGAQSTKPANI